MESAAGYLLEKGVFGPRAVLTSDWDAATERNLLKEPIAELELNNGKGWRGQNLSFLSNFPELLALKVIGRTAESVSPIHCLHNLRSLSLMTYCKTELRFSEFPNLIECAIEWRPKAMSLFDCISLKKLFVKGFRGSETWAFGRLQNLESLAILGSSIQGLKGLSKLGKLRSLRLGDMRKLQSLEGIENLRQLEKLEINTCRKIFSIKEVSSLVNLRELYLDNMGDIQSLKPLADLSQLRRVTFAESTNIVDGDLSPLLRLFDIDLVAFQNRAHYSHRREKFQSSSRGTTLAQ
jgi:Leucine-rich repeat (LRR) protein